MASANYRIIFRAIQKKQLLLFSYDGFHREAYAHVLGHTDGEERVLVYQVRGGSRHGLPREGAWRGPRVAEIGDLRAVKDDGFRGGDSHKKPSSWVKDVDIDVNRKAKQRYVWPDEEDQKSTAKADLNKKKANARDKPAAKKSRAAKSLAKR
jgi:hypothetical protein